MKPGGLTSWAWHAHSIGGKYRRLLVLEGADHKAVTADLDKERTAESKQFSEICPSHQDYLWDVQMTKP